MHPGRADILIYRPTGELVAAVEVKNRADLDPTLAVQLRRNLLVHGVLPPVPFFLLVSQDAGFLWTSSASSEDAPPTVRVPLEHVVSAYANGLAVRERLRGHELEHVIAAWLDDLAAGVVRPGTENALQALRASGFVEAIHDGRALRDLAA